MAQCLRVLAVLAKNLRSIPSIHMAKLRRTCNSSSRTPDSPLLALRGTALSCGYSHTGTNTAQESETEMGDRGKGRGRGRESLFRAEQGTSRTS